MKCDLISRSRQTLVLEDVGIGNLLVGPNGAGKTRMLRRISELSSIDDLGKGIPIEVLETKYPGLAPSLRNIWMNRAPNRDWSGSFYVPGEISQEMQDLNVHTYLDAADQKLIRGLGTRSVKTLLVPPRREITFTSSLPDQESANFVQADGRNIAINIMLASLNEDKHQLLPQVKEFKTNCCEVCGFDRMKVGVAKGKLHLEVEMGDQMLDADHLGDGLKQAIAIIGAVAFNRDKLLLIDEPEAHLHPSLFARLLDLLRESKVDYVLATHSNIALRPEYNHRVYECQIDDRFPVANTINEKKSLLESLGYSDIDNMITSSIVCVEGAHDFQALRYLIGKRLDGRKCRPYTVMPLGGDNMRYVELGLLSKVVDIFVLLDSEDSASATKAREELVVKCKGTSIEPHLLARRSLDNYWTKQAYLTFFETDILEWEKVHAKIWEVPEQSDLKEVGLPSGFKRKTVELARLSAESKELWETDLGDFVEAVVSKLLS